MARNPVRRRRPEPAPPPARPPRVIVGLFVAALVVAVAAPWLASSQRRPREAARPTPDAASVPVQESLGETSSEETPVSDGGAPRAFLDPAGAGATAYAAGEYETALEQYRAAIERNPQDAEAHSNLGQMLVRLKRPAEALPYFDRATALLPERWAYHFNRARALGLLERWDDAIAGYRQAQRIFPEDYATAFNLAQALHRKGDEAGAVEAYRRAIELDPSDASFRMALGISYERLQKPIEAAAAYSEYLRLSPDAGDAEKVRARIADLTRPGSQPVP